MNMQKKYKLNPDKEKVKKIQEALKKSNGFCPCSLVQDENTKCPCLELRTQNICHCELFVPVDYTLEAAKWYYGTIKL
jgi:ferredoxin-thioredoxin reductase catalytic subunit